MRNFKCSKGFQQEMQWYDTCYSVVKVTTQVLEKNKFVGSLPTFFPMPVGPATDLWTLESVPLCVLITLVFPEHIHEYF